MKTLLERPGTDQTLELLKLLVGKRLTRKVVQKILHESSGWFREELCQKLLSVAKEETLKMKDKDEHNTHKILCLALIASVTKREDDIGKLRKAISSEDCPNLNCFILLVSITKAQEDIRALLGAVVSSKRFGDNIKSFVWLAKITAEKAEYIEKARRELLSSTEKLADGSEDYYWIAAAGIDVADFTKQEKDILFVRKCVSRMEKDDYFLKSSIALSLFRTTRDDEDSDSAREFISNIKHLDFKKRQSAELAMLTKDPKDILAARQIIDNDEEALCYIAKATLNPSDIDKAYKAISGQTRLFMTSINEKDQDKFDALLSAATEAKRFDVVEKSIIGASGYHKVRDCVRVFKKLTASTN